MAVVVTPSQEDTEDQAVHRASVNMGFCRLETPVVLTYHLRAQVTGASRITEPALCSCNEEVGVRPLDST